MFDRHLVVMERYDGSNPVQNFQFNTTSFSVQIHGLPFSFMTIEVALSIGEMLGAVSIPKDTSELRGCNFMCIRVAIDITKSLCRGRCVTWDKDLEGWVSFKYERLPNICYWCGQLCHDDKKCVIWLQSKGTLVAEERQFGPSIRVAQYNPSRKTVVVVQGYDKSKNKNHASIGVVTPILGASARNATIEKNSLPNQLVPEGVVSLHGGSMEMPFVEISALEQATLNFEEIIRDTDESINGFKGNSNSSLISDDPNEINGEMTMLMDVSVIMADVMQVERDLVTDKSESVIRVRFYRMVDFK